MPVSDTQLSIGVVAVVHIIFLICVGASFASKIVLAIRIRQRIPC